MKYFHDQIEAKWQKYWAEHQTFKAKNHSDLPKYYVLDMFPYPSGAGLHVGHPLGYIASDIVARYKRHQGYNVLHPQGYDSFGLPAEQYAIQTGQHPAVTTETNIKRYREQLDKIGFSFDWSREVRTSEPDYYKWTQWIFIQLFESYYCKQAQKAFPISELVKVFQAEGNANVDLVCDDGVEIFSASEWNAFSEEKKQEVLLQYRLTYLAETEVNWCPALGTVLANDEIVNGVSERGGHPVIRKKMKQWSMRISAYAERLLQGLDEIDWSESLKESQRNWIGKSVGASVGFKVAGCELRVEVFTTRPDTIFGVTFMTLAPEHELVAQITTPEQKEAVEAYIEATAKRSERERMADVKTISGVFTGAFAEHPFTKEPIPIWIGDYVLAGYGTGAVMAVPCGDERDYAFANHFKGVKGMPEIKNIFNQDISEKAFTEKEGFELVHSDFLNGLDYKNGTQKAIEELERIGAGKSKVNYRLRDAVFSRQRYWGEPFPVYYVNGLPQMIAEKYLPIRLPEVEKYLPTEDGQPPLGNATHWAWDRVNGAVVSNELIDHKTVFPLELNTMPGWAGSSWYWLRYMDARNEQEFASAEALNYWENVDLYIGGSEHATGHLLYSRFWNKFLKDRGFIQTEEPFKKLINQGMILGMSAFVYRTEDSKKLISKNKIEGTPVHPIHVDLSVINDVTNELDIEKFKAHPLYQDYKDAEFILEDGKYIVGREVEKMSKSKYNVVNPDDICTEYGADTLRLYEMFLGPLEQAKPWNTAGISGVYGFLKKLWRLYYSGPEEGFFVSNEAPSAESLKTLHKTIKKVTEDIENFSFNTSVSQFMICVNELSQQKCNHRAILEPLAVLISPYAPHIAEELWSLLGHQESISREPFPRFEEKYLVESDKEYPVSFNGKTRFTINLPLDLTTEQIQEKVMADVRTLKILNNNEPQKIIIIPNKIINLVGIKNQEMSNKELFINSYLERISKSFEISKDRAFEVFSISTILDKGFNEVYNNIISNGSNDGGIDGIFFEEFGSYYLMHVFQCKNTKTLKQNDIDKFFNDVSDIFNKGLMKPNMSDIIEKIEEHKSLTRQGYVIDIKKYFIYNGSNNDSENSSNKKLNNTYGDRQDFEIYDSEKLYNKINELVKAQNKRSDIKFTFKPVKSNVVLSDNQALYTYSINNVSAVNFRMPAIELCNLIENEIKVNNTYDFLFSDNIRGFLGMRSKANQKMKKTLDDPNECFYFPFLNNGVTIICDSLTLPNGPQQGEYVIPSKNPIIVNGLQTTRVLYNKFKEDVNSLENVFVNVRLYQTNNDVKLVDRITDATNTQTPINFKDKISNKTFNELTKELFANNGVLYITKRGETFNSFEFRESVQSETVLKFWYATFYEKPEIAKNSISKVLEDIYEATNQENILSDLFNNDKESPIYRQLLIAYKIYCKVIKERKQNSIDEFIKYSDEILSYGVYKEVSQYLHDKFTELVLEDAYSNAYNYVKEIVKIEFDRYKSENKAFSYNSYFKTPKCRFHYNEKANILENFDVLEFLKSL